MLMADAQNVFAFQCVSLKWFADGGIPRASFAILTNGTNDLNVTSAPYVTLPVCRKVQMDKSKQ